MSDPAVSMERARVAFEALKTALQDCIETGAEVRAWASEFAYETASWLELFAERNEEPAAPTPYVKNIATSIGFKDPVDLGVDNSGFSISTKETLRADAAPSVRITNCMCCRSNIPLSSSRDASTPSWQCHCRCHPENR